MSKPKKKNSLKGPQVYADRVAFLIHTKREGKEKGGKWMGNDVCGF
jgi:hypothetical protein